MRPGPIVAMLLVACLLPAVPRARAQAPPPPPVPRTAAASSAESAAPGESVTPGQAAGRLTPEALDQSLTLGRQYLLNAQRPDGRFVYELDAIRGVASAERNIIREMGALWGVALFHRYEPTPATAAAVARAMRLQGRFAKRTRAGGLYLCEPDSREGTTNAMALYVLALQDFLAADHPLDPGQRARYEQDLAAAVKFILSLRMPGGRFFAGYRCADGGGFGAPEPYSDGEALLALVRAAKDSDDAALRKLVIESAGAMYVEYVRTAIQRDPVNEQTKGFYQWGSMAFYELYTTGWPGTAAYAPRTIAMARWIIGVHGVLDKPRHTGYAFEGLAVAWELARLTNDRRSQQHIGAAIDAGLSKLLTWQIGSPLAGAAVPQTFGSSPKTKGGIVSEPDDRKLRVDTVQHQMHATLLVRHLLFRPADEAAPDQGLPDGAHADESAAGGR